ncbi:MAG: hypothetical protein K9I74_04700 [Bacteroidales bacterium]|nr:hypothetical protein [Bacteroidales bacterium]
MSHNTSHINNLHKKLSNELLWYITGIVIASLISIGIVWRIVETAHSSISVGFHLFLIFYFGATILLSYVSFNGRRNDLQQQSSFQRRIKEYREAVGIKWMLWLTIAFLALVSMFISGEFLFLVYVGGTLLFFILDAPSNRRLEKDLNASLHSQANEVL